MWKRVSVDALGHHGPDLGAQKQTDNRTVVPQPFQIDHKGQRRAEDVRLQIRRILNHELPNCEMATGGRWVKLDGKFQFGYGRESKNQIGKGPSFHLDGIDQVHTVIS